MEAFMVAGSPTCPKPRCGLGFVMKLNICLERKKLRTAERHMNYNILYSISLLSKRLNNRVGHVLREKSVIGEPLCKLRSDWLKFKSKCKPRPQMMTSLVSCYSYYRILGTYICVYTYLCIHAHTHTYM